MCFICQIPSSAVEMPGSADVFGLNVQFGALDFGSESTVENLNQSERSCQEPVAAPQTQSNLYSKSTAIRSVCQPVSFVYACLQDLKGIFHPKIKMICSFMSVQMFSEETWLLYDEQI